MAPRLSQEYRIFDGSMAARSGQDDSHAFGATARSRAVWGSHRLGLALGGLLRPLAALRPVNCPDERRFWREGPHGPVGQQEGRQ